MIHKSAILSLAAGALALSSLSALAEAQKVPAGRTSGIFSFSLYDKQRCTFGPKPKVTFKQPANGTLSAKWQTAKINDTSPCNGKTMRAYVIYYKPKAGFRGHDSGSVTFLYPTFVDGATDRARTEKIELDVR